MGSEEKLFVRDGPSGGTTTCQATATKAALNQMLSSRPPSLTPPSTTDSPSLPRTQDQISSIAPANTAAPRMQAALCGTAKHSTCPNPPSLSATPSTALPPSISQLPVLSRSARLQGCRASTLTAQSVSRSQLVDGRTSLAWRLQSLQRRQQSSLPNWSNTALLMESTLTWNT